MPKYDIADAQSSNMSSVVKDVTPGSMNTDSATNQEETVYQNTEWTEQWGYFNNVPELNSALLMKATWNVGKGYTCDARTKAILDHVNGMGKDTFQDILFNMDLISRLSGDAYAEIVRDKETGLLLNLKPLDPGQMKLVLNKKGTLKEYRYVDKTTQKETVFDLNEIFHLSHNRLADQCHGISVITPLKKTILAEFENFDDLKKIMHRQAKPMILFKIGTDNAAKITAFVNKMDQATNKGENIYIPDDEHTVSYDVVQVNVSQVIMEWRNDIRNKFYRTLGLPQIVFGSAGTTESGGKMEYLAHEQVFERDQRFLELAVWNQLLLKINLISPVSLLENLQTDMNKDGAAQMMNMQQNDLTAGVGS